MSSLERIMCKVPTNTGGHAKDSEKVDEKSWDSVISYGSPTILTTAFCQVYGCFFLLTINTKNLGIL